MSAITTLEPPAQHQRAAPPRFGVQRPQHRDHLSVLVQVITRRATGPTRNVVSGASGTLVDPRAGEFDRLAGFTARNGSLTCYAAFIRLVGRLRRHRRTGSPGVFATSSTGWHGWPIPVPTRDAGFDAGRCEPGTTSPSWSSPCRCCAATGCRRWSPSSTVATCTSGARSSGDRSSTAPRTATVIGSILARRYLTAPRCWSRLETGGARLNFRATVEVAPAGRRQAGELHRRPTGRAGGRGTAFHHGVDRQNGVTPPRLSWRPCESRWRKSSVAPIRPPTWSWCASTPAGPPTRARSWWCSRRRPCAGSAFRWRRSPSRSTGPGRPVCGASRPTAGSP